MASLPGPSIKAGVWCDARSIAMAGSYTAVARGYDAIGLCPGNLGLSDRPWLRVQLFAIGSALDNNTFSISDYEKYNGANLSESDRQYILSMIPDEGLQFRGNVTASTLSLSRGPLVLATTVEASAAGSLSRDVVDLAFFGNGMGETIDTDLADGEAFVHADFNLAYGYNIGKYDWGELAVGVNCKYIRGITYMNVSRAEATATTSMSGIDADGSILIRTARGGSGLGLDVGIASLFGEKWTFSAGVRNLVSFINWNVDTEFSEYIFTVDSFSAETADDSTTIQSSEIDRDVKSFVSTLVPELNLGAARQAGDFLLAADLKFRLRATPGADYDPELSTGCEYSRISFMPLRAGISIGGFHGMSLGLGLGFRFSSFNLDLAWASSGTMLPSMGNGFILAVSSYLDFSGNKEDEDQRVPDTDRRKESWGPRGI